MMNTLGFALMGLDKKRAGEHQWRISERTLFLVAALGGSVGSWLGMYIFHHKTKHWYFVIGIPGQMSRVNAKKIQKNLMGPKNGR